MKCPRTGTELKEIEVHGIKVDISEACGGVWFDNFELKKFDESHEGAGEELVQLMNKYAGSTFNTEVKLKSPRHPEVTMMRCFYSSSSKIEIDVCPESGGIWLDAGELQKIRESYRDEKQRQEKGGAFVDETLEAAGFKRMNTQSTEEAQRIQTMTRVLRFLMPSSYLPKNILNLFFS